MNRAPLHPREVEWPKAARTGGVPGLGSCETLREVGVAPRRGDAKAKPHYQLKIASDPRIKQRPEAVGRFASGLRIET